ncbi:hypothetical protein IT6_06990 [Methylacidiphilum caldifontis]|uniref:hypothetical protein n=1 Tax=Methylacidiphilum caldifontis TaxID=2795386 RepID=UPI001A8C5461|nr:hypothetical protein [Methylacidiphilum caldifontis]QSR88129.1 hypothetical protein IT6_06990 [Methylacidiphilum caldifontis]
MLLPPTGAPGPGSLVWATTLTNNGTLAFSGPLSSANRSFSGSLINNGSIVSFKDQDVMINVNGSIVNNSGGLIQGGQPGEDIDNNVVLRAWQGGLVNYGTISGHNSIILAAMNTTGSGPYSGGGIFSNGTINFSADSGSSSFVFRSVTGAAFLGGTVHSSNENGITNGYFQSSSSPVAPFTLGTNVMIQNVTFNGGSLVGSGVLTTESINITATGNVNNRVGSNPLQNGFHLANGPWAPITNITINAVGSGPQAINLAIAGNASINSGNTSTFLGTSSSPSGLTLPVPNAASNLLVNASGNLTVDPSSTGPAHESMSNFIFGVNGFSFPGGIVLISGSALTLNTIVDNGYTTSAKAGQGIFFQAPTIHTTSPVITDGNTWVNFSTQPSSVPAIYAISQVASGVYNVTLNPGAFHIRSFSP